MIILIVQYFYYFKLYVCGLALHFENFIFSDHDIFFYLEVFTYKKNYFSLTFRFSKNLESNPIEHKEIS